MSMPVVITAYIMQSKDNAKYGRRNENLILSKSQYQRDRQKRPHPP